MKSSLSGVIVLMILGSFTLSYSAFPSTASAATYYVSPAGSDSNSGLSTAPFRTIQHAVGIVSAGDTVIVEDGVYKRNSSQSIVNIYNKTGNSNAWITIKAQHRWGAILDGEYQGDADPTNNTAMAFDLNGSQYIRVQGFEIRNFTGNAIFLSNSTNNVYLSDNKIHDIARFQILCSDRNSTIGHDGLYAGSSTSHLTMDSNIFYNIGRLPGGCPDRDYNHDHGIYYDGSYLSVRNNIFYNTEAGWGIQLFYARHVDVVKNTFHGSNPGRKGQIILSGKNRSVLIRQNISCGSNSHFLEAVGSADKKVVIMNNRIYGADLPVSACAHATCSGNTIGAERETDTNKRLKDDVCGAKSLVPRQIRD